MKASELRIGNWYNENGVNKTVSPSTIEELWIADRSWVQPIPITEEWLMKFGFEKHGKWFCKDALNSSIIHDKTTFGYNEEYEIPNIQHVHQLQNLYFALTGQELIINDNH